jgi:hypothetical protein
MGIRHNRESYLPKIPPDEEVMHSDLTILTGFRGEILASGLQ